jgi:hypothetical protein
MAVGRSAVAVLAALSVTAAAGCGAAHRSTTAPPTVANDPGPTPPVSDLALPPGVPDMSTGPAETAARRVINDWLKALRSGNVSLSCGAVATEMGGAGVYTIVTFRLTERKGGNCGTGVGGKARGAIRVERRHIKEWYRLPDEPGGAQQAPPAASGPVV